MAGVAGMPKGGGLASPAPFARRADAPRRYQLWRAVYVISTSLPAGTLTEDQSAHQRIKLTNTAAASDIAAVPGAANGWVHVFWNAAAHDVTLDAGGATVLLAPGDIFHVMCDGNDYYHVT